jgi:hypothetical protein
LHLHRSRDAESAHEAVPGKEAING